jgi:hypothetical protein
MKKAGHCKHLYISLSSFKKRFCKCICLLLDDLEYPLTFQNETKTGRPILQASKDWHPCYHGKFLKPVAYKVFFATFPLEDGKCYTGKTF